MPIGPGARNATSVKETQTDPMSSVSLSTQTDYAHDVATHTDFQQTMPSQALVPRMPQQPPLTYDAYSCVSQLQHAPRPQPPQTTQRPQEQQPLHTPRAPLTPPHLLAT